MIILPNPYNFYFQLPLLNLVTFQRGDRVLSRVEKSIDSLVLYLAAIRLGAVYVPLNPTFTLPETIHFVDVSFLISNSPAYRQIRYNATKNIVLFVVYSNRAFVFVHQWIWKSTCIYLLLFFHLWNFEIFWKKYLRIVILTYLSARISNKTVFL